MELGDRGTIGAYAVIEKNVEIADGCCIDAHAVIREYVRMGKNNKVHPHAVIGGLPQDLSFDAGKKSYVNIGDNNIFREGVTVNRATVDCSSTRIGSDCYFMNNSHVAHDCVVGNNCVFATSATLGGHVEIGSQVFLGGGAMIHQFCRIGTLAIVRGVTGVSKDVIPYTLVGGTPVRHYKLNTVGLRRAGIKGHRYKALSLAFRQLRKRANIQDLDETPELIYLKSWLSAESKRGIHGFLPVRIKSQ